MSFGHVMLHLIKYFGSVVVFSIPNQTKKILIKFETTEIQIRYIFRLKNINIVVETRQYSVEHQTMLKSAWLLSARLWNRDGK